MYGTTDRYGWTYGTTFERLLDSLKNRKASGICTTTSLVRRRRWIRTRKCLSQTAKSSYINDIETLRAAYNRLDSAIHDKKEDLKRVLIFENHRKQLFQYLSLAAYQRLLESPNMLQRYLLKLRRLRQVRNGIVCVLVWTLNSLNPSGSSLV